MKINKVKYLSGPNYYNLNPTIWIELGLEDLEEKPSNVIPGFTYRLLSVIPSLQTHTCSRGYPGGFVERLREGTWMGHILEHTALEIQHLAGISVKRGKTVTGERKGIYFVTYDYKEKESGYYAFQAAMEIVEGLLEGKEGIDAKPYIDKTAKLYYDNKLGPSTEAVYQAALARNIPTERIGHDNYVRLGTGARQKFVQATISSQTSYIAVENSCDKELTKTLLEAAGLPVPQGRVINDKEQLLRAGRELGYPLVIKPLNGRQGQGVATNLLNEEALANAYDYVTDQTDYTQFIVERYYAGDDHRFLVVDGQLAAASRRMPPCVIGDGVRTLRELIAKENEDPLRGEGHEKPMTRIPFDKAELWLHRMGRNLDQVPRKGESIQVVGNANLSTGGSAVDVTDSAHPSYAQMAITAAKAIGLDIAGIDIISEDVSLPYKEGKAVILEVNAAPGIRMHVYPSEGTSRDVGGAIVDYLFRSRQEAAIPIVAVTGTNGKTTTSRLAAHLMKKDGTRIGLTNSDGVWIDDTRIDSGDCSGPGSARKVLSNREVDLAILETARGGILREGLAFRHCDVGIVTNVTEDHLGLDGIETLDDLRKVKRLVPEVVLPEGACILNADDEGCAAMAEYTPGKVVFFALSADNPHIQTAVAKRQEAWYLHDGWIVYASDGKTERFLPVGDIPLTINGYARHNISNSLAALAAARSLGKSLAELRSRIITFFPTIHQSRGRFNVFEKFGRSIVADYAHNVAGIEAVFETVRRLPKQRVLTVSSAPGDRSDRAINQLGKAIGRNSDYFVIKEDTDLRGRKPLEAAYLLKHGSYEGGLEPNRTQIVTLEKEAYHTAWRISEPGDLLLMLHDDFEQFERFLQEIDHSVSRLKKVE